MPKFRNKPVEIEAEQFLYPHQIPFGVTCYEMSNDRYVAFINSGRQIRVTSGDWIVMRDGKPHGVISRDHFSNTYEPVPQETDRDA